VHLPSNSFFAPADESLRASGSPDLYVIPSWYTDKDSELRLSFSFQAFLVQLGTKDQKDPKDRKAAWVSISVSAVSLSQLIDAWCGNTDARLV